MKRTTRPVSIARETGISIVINMLFSAAFFAAMFGFQRPAEIGGTSGLGADFLPQSFMVALMSSLIPSLIVRAKLALVMPTVGQVLVQSLAIATLAAVVTLCGAWLLIASAGSVSLAPSAALLTKLGFAAALSAIVTPLSLIKLLRK